MTDQKAGGAPKRLNDRRHLASPTDCCENRKQQAYRPHEAYDAHLQHCLATGEEIRPSSSEVINKKLDNTSKKISRTARATPRRLDCEAELK